MRFLLCLLWWNTKHQSNLYTEPVRQTENNIYLINDGLIFMLIIEKPLVESTFLDETNTTDIKL
jgi:hypothetical protein